MSAFHKIRAALYLFLFTMSLLISPLAYASTGILWQIGKEDNSTAEFHLGPNGYSKYDRDGFYIVGKSDPKEDWPYAHPSVDDQWAGGGRHTFTILFAIEQSGLSGQCRLLFDLVDTHSINPPMLQININGKSYQHLPPKGAGDASIVGNPSAGKEHRFTIDFPATQLKEGINEITITTLSGSWILYDHLALETPASVKLTECHGTLLQSVRIDPYLDRQDGKLVQRMWVDVMQIGKSEIQALHITALPSKKLNLKPGKQTIGVVLAPTKKTRTIAVEIKQGSRTVAKDTAVQMQTKERQPADWVDPLLGTATSRWMLYPGPSTPFSFVKLSPDNQRQQWKAGYEYTIENIAGFSHLHSWTMGGLLVMPVTGPLQIRPGSENNPDAGYRSRFSHETEIAKPGYYGVMLEDYKIKAELTSTDRGGFMQFTFPQARDARILFDLETPTEYGYSVLDAKITKVSDREIEGYSKQQSGRYASWNEFTLHFVARFDKPFRTMGGWVDDDIQRNIEGITGKGDVGVFLNYSTKSGEIIKIKTGVS
ncbi:MAG: polysaccharide lyase family protein, partial [Candidatus Thorarchaeota archaeon]